MIGGYTDPDGVRAESGALLVGVHDRAGRLVYAGRVGTGFDHATLRNLGARLRKVERCASSFSRDGPRPPARGAHWVKPELVAEVAFTEWTRDQLLRHPAFRGLREDKLAAQIVRETSRARKPARVHPIAGGSDGPSRWREFPAPLAWSELSAKTEPAAFTVETVPKRLAALGKDPWADFFTVEQAITPRTITALALPAAPPPTPRRSGRAR